MEDVKVIKVHTNLTKCRLAYILLQFTVTQLRCINKTKTENTII